MLFQERMNTVKSQTEMFLDTQSLEYQKHISHIKELESTLQHQYMIQSQKTIPKMYTPKILQISNPLLTQKFKQEYRSLFFQQLDKAIESNTISLELHKAASNSIVTQIEHHTPSNITELYHRFISQNNIREHTPLPAIHLLINSNTTRGVGRISDMGGLMRA